MLKDLERFRLKSGQQCDRAGGAMLAAVNAPKMSEATPLWLERF